jgi:hypothetical protein
VPLPPVKPLWTLEMIYEERDSYDENVGLAPYADDWSGRLPGPGVGLAMGLVWRDVRDFGGYVTGRVKF